MKMTPYIILVLLVLIFPQPSGAASNTCTIEEDTKADDAIGRAKDWGTLYRIYSKFESCDNGGTAELFDDAVIKILAYHWTTTRYVVNLMARDRKFKLFVISHISATGELKDLKKIRKNARSNCFQINQQTCDLIEVKSISAIKTLEALGE